MVRWGRNESNTGGGMSYPADPFVNFVTRQLSAFARLRPLRHFYLKLTRITEIKTGYTKTAGSNLLDRRIFPISVFFTEETGFVLTAFTAIALASNPVHRDRQRTVRLVRNRTKRHGTGCKAFEDILFRLYFAEWNGFSFAEFQKTPERDGF